jgi:hypothetical protein
MKRIITLSYIVMGSAPNYSDERERWLWGHGLYHAGRQYNINVDTDELMANVGNSEKLLEIIQDAVKSPESDVRGTCWDIIMDRATPEDVRYSEKFKTIAIDERGCGIMALIDLNEFHCPSCGGEARVHKCIGKWYASCTKCHALSKPYGTEEQAREAWNMKESVNNERKQTHMQSKERP